MAVAKTLGSYTDVQQILDEALRLGGAKYTLPSRGKAIHWRQRAYAFRKLLHETQAQRNIVPGLITSTPYDSLDFILSESEKHEPTSVLIKIGSQSGQLFTLEGGKVTLGRPEPKPQSQLDFDAADLINKHS